uniref:DUF6061 family protein n=1 Tax=Anaerotruncus massiliensis (ex Liu et al. 2021) TaxID=2321404 RepID=UPI003AB4FBFC
MKHLISCEFNFDTVCVELKFSDGTMIAIDTIAVENEVANNISFVSQYEAHFRVEMEQKLRLQSEETIKIYKKRLAQAEKRIGELDRLFIKIYEDNAKGNLSDERFAMMSKTYEDEQAQLKVEIVNLQKEVEVQERQI